MSKKSKKRHSKALVHSGYESVNLYSSSTPCPGGSSDGNPLVKVAACILVFMLLIFVIALIPYASDGPATTKKLEVRGLNNTAKADSSNEFVIGSKDEMYNQYYVFWLEQKGGGFKIASFRQDDTKVFFDAKDSESAYAKVQFDSSGGIQGTVKLHVPENTKVVDYN